MKRLILATITAVAVLAAGAPSPAAPGDSTGTSPSGASTITIDQPLPHTLVPAGTSVQVSGTVSTGSGPIPPAPVNLVYVVDVSQGTGLEGGDCGDPNSDGAPDTVLDCEIAGLIALNSANLGLDAEVSIVAFDRTATIVDLGPAEGVQTSTGPATDADGNGTLDVEEALRSLRPMESTADFDAPLRAVQALIVQGESNSVLFVSDGRSDSDVGPTTGPGSPLQALIDAEATVSTFAVNPVPGGCDLGEPLQTIAIGGGGCQEITAPEQMILPLTPVSFDYRVEVEVNGHVVHPTVESPGRFSVLIPAALLRPGRNTIIARAFGPEGSPNEFAEAVTFVIVKGPRR